MQATFMCYVSPAHYRFHNVTFITSAVNARSVLPRNISSSCAVHKQSVSILTLFRDKQFSIIKGMKLLYSYIFLLYQNYCFYSDCIISSRSHTLNLVYVYTELPTSLLTFVQFWLMVVPKIQIILMNKSVNGLLFACLRLGWSLVCIWQEKNYSDIMPCPK